MTLYLECNMGIAGDMLMGALFELLPDRDLFLRQMRALGLSGVEIASEPSIKCGIAGTKMRVNIHGEEEVYSDFSADQAAQIHPPAHYHDHTHNQPNDHGHSHVHLNNIDADDDHGHNHAHDNHEHIHYGYSDVCTIINDFALPNTVKSDALEVYRILGEAEAAVHGVSLSDIRFHELGTMDAVIDIIGCCLLINMIGADKIEASPVHVGSGFVRCAHGIMPVPAPATANILKGIPIYSGKMKGELCTPTGAALLRHFVSHFGDMTPRSVSKIGYGMGTKDFEAANCVRAFLSDDQISTDDVTEISCNLDDMTPEAMGYTLQILLEHGALDVYTTPINMKKSRPAVMLSCLCHPKDQQSLSQLILEYTTTFGVRYKTLHRDILNVSFYTITTPYGDIRIKTGTGHGIIKEKPEYDDIKAAADRHQVPFSRVWAAANSMMKSTQS